MKDFYPLIAELVRATGRLASEVEDGLWELVAAGLVTADGYDNLRALVDPKRRRGKGRGRAARPRHAAGRWALFDEPGLPQPAADPLNLTGIVFPGPRVSALSGGRVELLPVIDIHIDDASPPTDACSERSIQRV
jgi:hypothetical protein